MQNIDKELRKRYKMENTIDAEIISKTEKFWREVKERTEKSLFETQQETKINKQILKFAERQIEKEKEKEINA